MTLEELVRADARFAQFEIRRRCGAVGMPSDDEPCRVAAAEAQLTAVRAVLHKPEHLWQCGCCTAVLDALGDDA